MEVLTEAPGKAERQREAEKERNRNRETARSKVVPMSDAGKRPLLPGWPCSHQTKPQLC